MRTFVIKVVIFSSAIAISMYFLFLRANGFSDEYYLRFVTPPKSSLIVGTSRAALGIRPDVINTILGRNDILNYSFSMLFSPYGPTYLESISKKVDPASRDGIFIVTVDPFSIATTSHGFIEDDLFVGKLRYVNQKPNIQYMLDFYDDQFYHLFMHNGPLFLHNDGWLEATVPMDSASVRRRMDGAMAPMPTRPIEYQYSEYHYSQERFDFLEKTIDFLKQHGKVYLVQLPVHPEWTTRIDTKCMPDFNDKLLRLKNSKHIPYLDLTQHAAEFQYTDGLHLYKGSAEGVSKMIGEWIKGPN